MSIVGSEQWMYASGEAVTQQSLKFNDDESQYLSWTPAAAGNRKTWTWSGWVKLGNISIDRDIFTAAGSGTQLFECQITSSNTIQVWANSQVVLNTTQVLRDTSAWYHLMYISDTTQATASDRFKIYLNGTEVTAFATDNRSGYSQNFEGGINSTVAHYIGQNQASGNRFDGYLSDVYFIDGQALDPTSFGQFTNGYWEKIDYAGSYGTNGFHLTFADDVVSEGFNAVTYRGNGGTQSISGLGFSPDFVWIKGRSAAGYNHVLNDSVRGGNKTLFSNDTAAEYTDRGVGAFDADGFTFTTYNGDTSNSGVNYVAWCWDAGTTTNFVTNGSFDESISGWTVAQGTVTWDAASKRAYLQGPAGVSLEQTITGLDTSKTYYYTVNLNRTSGTSNFGVEVDGNLNYVSGASYTNYTASGFFTPSSSSIVFDVWGGTGMYFYADDVQVFEANTQGSITSAVKANPSYGFSIVSYTGTGANATVGHGLSSAPEMVIVKARSFSPSAWSVYTGMTGAGGELLLNTTAAYAAAANAWNNTAPTSSVFTVGTAASTNQNTATYIAYCFSSVAGYSSIGSYTGNGSTSGPTVTTNFNPAFLLVKRTDTTGNWFIWDNTRDTDGVFNTNIHPNSSVAEAASGSNFVTPSSTGFQLTGTGAETNASGGTYIYMAFADTREAAFWKDVSGQGNHWTPNNLDYRDSLVDSPANNFATFNAIGKWGGDNRVPLYSEGNLKISRSTATNGYANSGATIISPSSGYWYAEYYVNGTYQGGNNNAIGIISESESLPLSTWIGNTAGSYNYFDGDTVNGTFRNNGTISQTVAPFGSGDIVMIALGNGKLWFGKNGTWLGSGSPDPASGTDPAYSGLSGNYFLAAMTYNHTTTAYGYDFTANFGQDSTFAGAKPMGAYTDDNGIGNFQYAPPAGYLALCTANLPTPTIIDGSKHFNTVLYTGDGTSSKSVTGAGHAPDFLWFKKRSGAESHHLGDTIRGASKRLVSNTTAAETTESGLVSFDSDGFTISGASGGSTNDSGATYAAWSWKAGGAAVSNTAGSITSQVSANVDAGFSIVSYTGTGAVGTVGHGLSSEPKLIITKPRSQPYSWGVYNAASGPTKYMYLEATSAAATDSAFWNNTSPTSSVWTMGSEATVNQSGVTYIAYCFADVEGYSKAGSYTGNGSSDGPFVYTGFRPAWLMIKRTDSAADWIIWDDKRNTYNELTKFLYPNLSAAEATGSGVADLLSNGFKLRNAGTANRNASGGTYIYLAFAENPFKYANAR